MTGSRLGSLSFLALVGATAALVACGGGSDTSTTSSGSSGAASTAAVSPSEGSASSGSAAAGGGGNAASSLSDQASKAMDQDFTITYSMNGSSAAASSMTVYWQASTKNWRVDMETSAGTITLLQAGSQPIYCLEAQKTCTKSAITSEQTSQIPFFAQGLTNPDTFATYVTDQLGVDVTTSSKRIAGVNATCYDAGSGGTSGEVCFANDDLVLAWTGSVGGQQIGLVATKVDDSVSAKDFEPPYKVADLGNVMPP